MLLCTLYHVIIDMCCVSVAEVACVGSLVVCDGDGDGGGDGDGDGGCRVLQRN